MNKGQLSIFILVGVLIAVLLLFIMVWISLSDSVNFPGSPDVRAQRFIEQCGSYAFSSVVATVSQQGGYYTVSPPSISILPFVLIPLYKDEDVHTVPDVSVLEQHLGDGLREQLADCFIDLINLGGYSMESLQAAEISIELRPESVVAQVSPQVLLYHDERELRIDTFLLVVSYPLLQLHEVGLEAFSYIQSQELIPASQLARLAARTDIEIDYTEVQSDTMVYTLLKQGLREQYIYRFGVRYES